MNIIYLLLFCLFGYATLFCGSLKWKKSILYTVAIGCIVNANIFNGINYPIEIGGLTFGMNSVIYVLFLFSILIMYIDFGKTEALTLIICSIGAIVFASIIQFLTSIASFGYNNQYLFDLLSYFASCISSFASGVIVIKMYDLLKSKNVNIYVATAIVLVVSSLIDSIIYYGITLCLKISVLSQQFWLMLGTLYLGKLISIAFALVTLILLKKYCKTDAPATNENID